MQIPLPAHCTKNDPQAHHATGESNPPKQTGGFDEVVATLVIWHNVIKHDITLIGNPGDYRYILQIDSEC